MKEPSELSDLEKIKFILKGYLKDYLFTCYAYDFKHDDATKVIEITIKKREDEDAFIFLRMGIAPQNKEIYIYNIFLPKEDRGQNLALGAVNVLFQVAKMMNYRLVLHSMVDSFYNAMLKKGAKETSSPDCLEVTDDTDLGELRLNI
ncbi:MAG: hypothetical protein ABI207_08365 [Crocinitomicaceae bacterium]